MADRIMEVLLRLLSAVGPKSSVPDVVFATIGGLASAIDEDMAKYMEAFAPFLYGALRNHEEPGLCSMAIGLTSDVVRALGEKAQPYCDTFMNLLLDNLRVRTWPCNILGSLTSSRVLRSVTSSSPLSCNASETWLKLSAFNSSLTFRLWAPSCSRLPISTLRPKIHSTWLNTLCPCARVSWMLGEASSWQ